MKEERWRHIEEVFQAEAKTRASFGLGMFKEQWGLASLEQSEQRKQVAAMRPETQ